MHLFDAMRELTIWDTHFFNVLNPTLFEKDVVLIAHRGVTTFAVVKYPFFIL